MLALLRDASLMAQQIKNLPAIQETQGTWVHACVGKISWRRKWQLLQYPCLKNPMARGSWWATVQWVSKSWARLNDEVQHRDVELEVQRG